MVMEEEVKSLASECHQGTHVDRRVAGAKRMANARWTAKGADPAHPLPQRGSSRAALGQLRVVRAQQAAAVGGVGYDDART
jgi:hypothetical protein